MHFFYFIGGITNLIFSTFVLFQNPKRSLNISFFIYSFLLGVWLLCWAMVFNPDLDTLLFTKLLCVPGLLIPFFFNSFCNCLNFSSTQLKKIEKTIHVTFIVFFACLIPTDLVIESAKVIDNNLDFADGGFYNLLGIYIFLGMFSGVLKILPNKNQDYHEKQIRKYLILGISFGTFNAVLFSFILPYLGFVTLNKFSTFSSVFLVGFCSYAITRHKLLNINILISKTVSYIITSILFISSFLLVMNIKMEYFEFVTIPTYITIVISMILGMTFFKIRKLIQNTSPLHLLERYNLGYFSKDIINLYVDCYDVEGFRVATKKFFSNKLGIRISTIFINTTFLDNQNSKKLVLKNISNVDEELKDVSLFSKSMNFVTSFQENMNPEIKFFIDKYKTELVFSVFKKETHLLCIFLEKSNNLNLKSIDPEVFEALASQINIVLDRIKPFEQVKNDFSAAKHLQMKQLKEKSILETEYNIAKTIQERFLPKEIVNIPEFNFEFIYQPSRYVGGDYFDIHSEGKHKMGFLICDVVGKGLESSFTTIQLHSIFHSKVSPKDSPSVVMSKLNNSIYQLRTQKNHCAAFYLELNPVTKTIKYADAGNGLCYLARKGKLVELNDFGGMVLGACQESTYTEGEIALQKDDLLFLSTDGILDFKNDKSERFGVARMERLIVELAQKKDKKNYVTKSINEFRNTNDQFQDDITLLTISVSDKFETSKTSYVSTQSILQS